MNVNKKFTFEALLIFQLVLMPVAVSQDLQLSIRLDQSKLVECQPVWVAVAIINNGPTDQEVQPLVLTEDPSRGIRFRLTDESGNIKIQVGGVIAEYAEPPKPRRINSRDSISKMFEMLPWFSTSGIRNAPVYIPTTHYLRAGIYRLQAIQFTGEDTLRSNVAVLTIQKASGNSLQALRALRKADSTYVHKREYATAVEEYERVLKLFPQNVYGPYIYDRLIFIYHYSLIQNTKKAFDLVLRMAQTFPNDAHALNTLSSYAPILFREGRDDILQKLSRDFPATKVGQFSKQKLEEK